MQVPFWYPIARDARVRAFGREPGLKVAVGDGNSVFLVRNLYRLAVFSRLAQPQRHAKNALRPTPNAKRQFLQRGYRTHALPPQYPPGVFVLIAHGGQKTFVLISHGLVRNTPFF
jgi:hypothetical protein